MAVRGYSAVRLRRVEAVEQAERERFLGSPTVRVDGCDVDPAAAQRSDYGLKWSTTSSAWSPKAPSSSRFCEPEYADLHLPSALNIPQAAQPRQHRTARPLPAGDRLLPRRLLRHELASRVAARDARLEHVYDYAGGKADWLAHPSRARGSSPASRVPACGKAPSSTRPPVPAEQLIEPGPSTVRADTPARTLLDRLASRQLNTALVTTPERRRLGVFSRASAERRLRE